MARRELLSRLFAAAVVGLGLTTLSFGPHVLAQQVHPAPVVEPSVDQRTMQMLGDLNDMVENMWKGQPHPDYEDQLLAFRLVGKRVTLEKLDAIQNAPEIKTLEKVLAEIAVAIVQRQQTFADLTKYTSATILQPPMAGLVKGDLSPEHRCAWEFVFLFPRFGADTTRSLAIDALARIGDVTSLKLLEAVYPLSLQSVGAVKSGYILLGPSKWPRDAMPSTLKTAWSLRRSLHAAVGAQFSADRVPASPEDKRTVIASEAEETSSVEDLAGALDKTSLETELGKAEPDSDYAKFLKEMLDLKADAERKRAKIQTRFTAGTLHPGDSPAE